MSDDARPQWNYARDDGRTSSWKGWLWTIAAGVVWFGLMAGLRPQGVTVVRERLAQFPLDRVFENFAAESRFAERCACGSPRILDLRPSRRVHIGGIVFGKDQEESQSEILFFSEEKGTRVRWIWNARRSPLSSAVRGIRGSEQIVGPAIDKALDRLMADLK